MKYLVTAIAEVYRWEEADSEEEALTQAHGAVGWQLSGVSLKGFKVKVGVIDADGIEVEPPSSSNTPKTLPSG
jgi:hypothetical protein